MKTEQLYGPVKLPTFQAKGPWPALLDLLGLPDKISIIPVELAQIGNIATEHPVETVSEIHISLQYV